MKAVKVLVILAVLANISLHVGAFRLVPMVKEFAPTGTESRQSFNVINDSTAPLAVRIEMVHREIDEHGTETLRDASDLFSVFPQQMVVQPNSQQIVRVQWRGPQAVAQELPFRIIARQLPVDFQEEQRGAASISVMFVYQGSVYITPPRTTVNLVLDSVSRSTSQDGKPMLSFSFINRGNVHTIINNAQITVRTSRGGSQVSQVSLDGAQIGLNGINVLPGNRRIFTIPWPEALIEGDLDASFTYTRLRL